MCQYGIIFDMFMQNFLRRHSRKIIGIMLLSMMLYGVGRLYFTLTAGFTRGNITADLTQEPDHKIPPLTHSEQLDLENIIQQPFRYLGKGCQSYVFISQDGNYVLKFLKYQRFRPQAYLDWFAFIPSVQQHREKKMLQKRQKLDALLESWKIAYNFLSPETGLVYLHLNKSDSFSFPLTIIDKMGWEHKIPPDEVVFLVQRTAKMLCKSLQEKMQVHDVEGSKQILGNLLSMLQSEYQRGLGDNDHALMQNTGVIGNQPIHIDVGQFSSEARFKNLSVSHYELFSKTYKFRIWLAKYYPELESFLTKQLLEIIGPQMHQMKPQLKTVDEGA